MPDFRSIVREGMPAADADRIEELAQHLEERFRELCSVGLSAAEAEQAAAAEFRGGPAMPTWAASAREAEHAGPPAGGNWISDFLRDLRFSGRTIRHSPLFAGFVVLTLGLGIGANTTVFTIINSAILNPLPVDRPSSLAAVAAEQEKSTAKARTLLPVSYADLKDYQSRNQAFGSLAGFTMPRPVTVSEQGDSRRMFAEFVTANYFGTLGLRPARGRFFLPEEDGAPGAHPVAVLNYAAWQVRFGAAEDVVGKTVVLNRIPFTVVGVAPPGFIGVNAVFGPDLWIPAAMSEQLAPVEMRGALTDRAKTAFFCVGRLRPRLSRAAAGADMTTIAAALAREYPDVNQGRTVAVRPLSDILFNSSGAGRMPMVTAAAVLLAVVGIVLLIACSNVANLLLARATARRQEIAVRLAMGASRGRLVRQLLTESMCLALLSGAAGGAIAFAGLKAAWAYLPAGVTPNMITPKLDGSVLLFGLLLSVLTGLVFGAFPALRASRIEVSETLKDETRTAGRSRRGVSFANALLVAQVSFSFLCLVTAALFLRSIERAYELDPGFETRHLAVVLASPGQAGYDKTRTTAFYKDARDRVAALPAVESVSWASNLPFWGRVVSGLEIEGHEARSKADKVSAVLNTVDLDYFRTSGVALVRGRDFSRMDRDDSRPVAIVNEKLARDYWPGREPLGQHVRLPNETTPREVVGIARTANYSTLGEPPQPCVYLPMAQSYSDSMTLYVRTKGDPAFVLASLQRELRAAGPGIWLDDARTGRSLLDNVLFGQKGMVGLLGVFGVLALGLAGIGLYGLMAYSVGRRKREIGVRMALGAARQSVVALVLKEGMSLVLVGIGIGLLASLGAGRLLARMLFGVSAADPLSIGGAAVVLLGVGLAACYLPARSASRLDPLAALREG